MVQLSEVMFSDAKHDFTCVEAMTSADEKSEQG